MRHRFLPCNLLLTLPISQPTSDDLQFHSVNPEQLQQITVEDVEAGNLFPDLIIDDSVPMALPAPQI